MPNVCVTVSKWCPSPAESKHCLKEFALTDLGEIDAAVKTTPWTSSSLIDDVADALIDCINKCGGEAARAT